MIDIVPAVMPESFEDLREKLARVAGIVPFVQIDVMDGNLVPSVSFPYNQTTLEGKIIPYSDSINFEIHLMVQNPKGVGANFIRAGAKKITAQIEGFKQEDAAEVFRNWRKEGIDTGVSLLLNTPFKTIAPLIEENVVSSVQVMSIARVGYQGEKFDERALVRISELRELYPDVTIAVDGGVSSENLKSLFDAGANSFNIGSAIMKSKNPEDELIHLQKLLNSFAHVA